MSHDRKTLSDAEVSGAEGLGDWRVLLGALHARFATGDMVTGARLLGRIVEAAEKADHHPDLDLRYAHLSLKLVSHDVGGITARDVRLARRISELAAEEGLRAVPAEVQSLEIGLDTWDFEAVKPFWAAVLGISEDRYQVSDRDGLLPPLWFQPTDSREPDRQRFHLDITVPHDVAEQRIAAALAAGGTVVSEARKPAFTVLADAEGNKVCVCTWQGRD